MELKKIFLISTFLCFQFSLFAQSFNWKGSGEVFALEPVKDGILIGSGLLLSGGDLLLDNALKVNRAEFDPAKTYSKDDVNGFDRLFMQEYSSSLDRTGDVMVALTMMTPAVLAVTDKEEWLTIGVMYAETLLIANGIKEVTKLAVRRDRPFMYYDPSTYPEDDIEDGDFANSFPSGHSTMAFAGATFASYTFSKYFPDSPYRYAVTGGSYALAFTTAALRMKSGNHFMTDVLAGAAIGTAVGFLVPWCHSLSEDSGVKLALIGNGVAVKVEM